LVLKAESNSRNNEALRPSPDKTKAFIPFLSPVPLLLFARLIGCRLFRMSVAVLEPSLLLPDETSLNRIRECIINNPHELGTGPGESRKKWGRQILPVVGKF